MYTRYYMIEEYISYLTLMSIKILFTLNRQNNSLIRKLQYSDYLTVSDNLDSIYSNGCIDVIVHYINDLDYKLKNIHYCLSAANGFLDVLKLLDLTCKDTKIMHSLALIAASSNGYLDVVIYLHKIPTNLNLKNNCAIKRACENGYLNVVNYLQQNGCFFESHRIVNKIINSNNFDALTFVLSNYYTYWLTKSICSNLVNLAINKNNLNIVKLLHNFNSFDLNNTLITASKNGYLQIVEYLISHGAQIDFMESYAFRLASRNGHIETVKYFINLGINIEVLDNYALRFSSSNGHFQIVKILISNGANIVCRKNEALRRASANGYFKTVKFLIEYGANLSANNNESIRLSAKNGHLRTVKILLTNGAFLKSKNNYAIRKAFENNYLKVFHYLFNLYNDYLTIICWASKNNHLDIIAYLHKLGVDINNHVYLVISSKYLSIEVFKYFCLNYCNPNLEKSLVNLAQNGDLKTIKWLHNKFNPPMNVCFMQAVECNQFDIVKCLVNYCNFHHKAFKKAVQHGHLKMVKYLYRMKFNLVDYDYIYVAHINNRSNIVDYLVENGFKSNVR